MPNTRPICMKSKVNSSKKRIHFVEVWHWILTFSTLNWRINYCSQLSTIKMQSDFFGKKNLLPNRVKVYVYRWMCHSKADFKDYRATLCLLTFTRKLSKIYVWRPTLKLVKNYGKSQLKKFIKTKCVPRVFDISQHRSAIP